MPRKRRSKRRLLSPEEFFGILIILGLLVYLMVSLLAKFWIYVAIVAVIILSVFIYWQLKKRQRIKLITSEIDKHLLKALEAMDTTDKWYNDEDEANRELVSCLKSQDIDAIYHYRLPNGRTADAKVYDFLIEGKLSPNTTEVDRLIGQLSNYSEYPYKINVVIYGELAKDAKRRIEKEIDLRYVNKVFLTYLDNPRRQRSEQ
jgi:hypothetical protein